MTSENERWNSTDPHEELPFRVKIGVKIEENSSSFPPKRRILHGSFLPKMASAVTNVDICAVSRRWDDEKLWGRCPEKGHWSDRCLKLMIWCVFPWVDLYFSPVYVSHEFRGGWSFYFCSDAVKSIWSHCSVVTAIISVKVKIEKEVTLFLKLRESQICTHGHRGRVAFIF